jgi:hypothetical protein
MQRSIAAWMVAVTLVIGGGHAAAGQQTSSSSKKTDQPSTITLTGCISGKPLSTGEYTFVENVSGSKYRLAGKGMKKYAGQSVEIVSGPNKALAIKGGLFPSPNVAAQSGALDPAEEARAHQPGGPSTGTDGPELPEFRVARVRGVPGACQ